jgi:hypothetical protein
MKRGDRFTLGGRRYRVLYVNACRAHCEAIVKERRLVQTRRGEAKTFIVKRRVRLDVAPGADPATITELLGGVAS